MKWKMLFRIGLTLVVVVAVVLFYLNNVLHNKNSKEKISELVRSENMAFHEAIIRHNGQGKEASGNHGAAERAQEMKEDSKKNRHDERERNIDEKLTGEVKGGKVAESVRGLGEGAQKGGGEKGALSGGEGDASVHRESAGSVSASGLKPVHRRVGSQVNGQVSVLHLAVVACGDRVEDVMVMLKSAVLLTTDPPLVLHIFADRPLHTTFISKLHSWPAEILERVEYRMYDVTFPVTEKAEDWRKLFKTCATQRLFIPTLLQDVDSLIYVDTDVIFLTPLPTLWAFFSAFNATQLVAVAPEGEDPTSGWYNRFARHPYVPPLGVNSGVMLMNLTRLRQSTWLPSMVKFFNEYRLKIPWGDQDLINVYFHFHPEELYTFSCDWNYRPDHCMYMSVCKSADQHGAYVLHGSRGVMHNDKRPAFKAVYTAFKNYQFGQDFGLELVHSLRHSLDAMGSTPCASHCVRYQFGQDVDLQLVHSLRQSLDAVGSTPCGSHPHIFLTQLQRFVRHARAAGGHSDGGHQPGPPAAEKPNHKPPLPHSPVG
ncbi:hypothetical protein ACOMHN_037561 [Nucella lapillus]